MSSLLGQTPSLIKCNHVGGCYQVPIQENPRKPKEQISIEIVRSKEEARNLLYNRPKEATCLLIAKRTASGLKLRNSTLLTTFAVNSLVGQAVNEGVNKPSPILVYRVAGDPRGLGSCEALTHTEIPENKLEMIFPAEIGDLTIQCLFDTGATNCFVERDLLKKLNMLSLQPS